MGNEALTMFLDEVDEELKIRGEKKTDFTFDTLGGSTQLSSMRKSGGATVKTLQKIADGLDMRLIICLGDKD